MRRLLGVLLAAASLAPACGAPPDGGGKTVWGLSGQSNAVKLKPYLSRYAAVVGYAKTSMAIDQWNPRGPMWVRLAPALDTPMSAFIWWQGEANNNDPAGTYRARLADLVSRIRRAARQPDLLFVVVRVGPNYRPPKSNIWHEEDAFVSADRDAILIPSDDLEFADAIHMTDLGYTHMAGRIAQTLGVTSKPE
jgi:carbohydrate esterase-like sialic acid-specific acetylesterase